MEQNQFYFSRIRTFFKSCFDKDLPLCTASITIEEYCVYPLSNNNEKSVENFNMFIKGMNIEVVPVSREIAFAVAKIRAKYKTFKALDSIHLATAKLLECKKFITNDKQLKQVQEISVFTMDNFAD